MNGYRKEIIAIHTTPKELREIADKMENAWPNLRPGDSVITSIMWLDNYTELHFGADQDKMNKELKK